MSMDNTKAFRRLLKHYAFRLLTLQTSGAGVFMPMNEKAEIMGKAYQLLETGRVDFLEKDGVKTVMGELAAFMDYETINAWTIAMVSHGANPLRLPVDELLPLIRINAFRVSLFNLEFGQDVKNVALRDEKGGNLMHVMVENGQEQNLADSGKCGWVNEARKIDGNTPLHLLWDIKGRNAQIAERYGDTSDLKQVQTEQSYRAGCSVVGTIKLLEVGANIDIPNHDGIRPVDIILLEAIEGCRLPEAQEGKQQLLATIEQFRMDEGTARIGQKSAKGMRL